MNILSTKHLLHLFYRMYAAEHFVPRLVRSIFFPWSSLYLKYLAKNLNLLTPVLFELQLMINHCHDVCNRHHL